MRRFPCVVSLGGPSLVFALLCALGAKTAHAGSCDRPLVSACVNSDTLWPSAGPTRFATIAGTQTTAPQQFSMGLVATYLQRPIVLAVPSPGPTGSKQNAVSDQVNGNFLFGYGVTNRLALHIALPVTFGQAGSGTAAITGGEDLRDTALRDVRFGLALALLAEPRSDAAVATPDRAPALNGALTARLDVSAPTGDRTQFAGERGGVFAPSLAFGATFGRFFGGGEAGARLRGVSQFSGARVGTQLAFSLGLGASILPRDLLAASVEARVLPTLTEQSDTVQGATGLVSTPNGLTITPAEWMLALRTAPLMGGDFVVTGGGGTGLPLGGEAVTRPRLRFLLGVTYAPRAFDSDGDGVLDKDDACPGVAGIRTVPAELAAPGKTPPRKGCPLPRQEDGPPVDFTAPLGAPGKSP
ncbi:MAG: hypothetical protein IPG50_00475 [Myxococcales bacterium]|nr:hypothetical protein [Myxococcales bacterium]